MDGSQQLTNSPNRTWIAVAATILLCALAASSGSIRLWERPDPTSPRSAPLPAAPASEDAPQQDIEGTIDWPDLSWLLDVVNVLAVLFLLLAIALTISTRDTWMWKLRRRSWRRPTRAVPEPSPEFQLAPLEIDIVAAGEALAVGTPRNAIVRCWMQLERDASAAGLARLESETATEYVERVVASSSVDPGPIVELAALYREARFSRHELDGAHREGARRAVRGVAAQLLEETQART